MNQLAVAELVRRRQADPLSFWRHSSETQRQATRYCAEGLKLHLRASGRFGKTEWGAHFFTALARGLESLDGERLPRLRTPNVGYLNVEGRREAVDASIAKYHKAIGDWPHYDAMVQGSLGYVGVIYVATRLCEHGNEEYCETCSRVVVHPDDGTPPQGVDIDWFHCDEYPSEPVLDELMARVSAGRQLYGAITATPTNRKMWEPIKTVFDGSLNRPVLGKVELCGSVYENRALTKANIQALEDANRNADGTWKQLARARLHGEYVDIENLSPFADWWEVLERWKQKTYQGEMNEFAIRRDDGSAERPKVEVWKAPKALHRYYIPIDPSRGVPGNDPSAIHVWDYGNGRPELAARFGNLAGVPKSGFASPYSLGALAAALHRSYNAATVEPEVQGGWGDAVLVALRQNGCSAIGRDRDPGRHGHVGDEGFRTTAQTRPLYFAEIQGALEESRQSDSVLIYSQDAISSLMSVRTDVYGRPEEKGLRHGEDVICMGRAIHVMGRVPKDYPKPVQAWNAQDLLRHGMGLRTSDQDPWPEEVDWR